MSDILTFRGIGLLLSYSLISAIFYQFVGISTELLIRRYSFSLIEAKNLLTIFSMETAITMPIFGLIFNYYRGRVIWGLVGSVLCVLGFVFFLVLGSKCGVWIHIPLFLISQYASIAFIVISSMMSLGVPSRSVGVLFGFASVVDSTIATLQTVIIGETLKHQNFGEFQTVLKFFLGMSASYLAINIALLIFDLNNGGLLMMLESDARVQQLRDKLAYDSESRVRR